MKKVIAMLGCLVLLAGCGEKGVSGKYVGVWETKGYKITVEPSGDAYYVKQWMPSTGEFSAPGKEDDEGYLIFSNSGKRLLKFQDENTSLDASSERTFKRVQ
jgi:uncharacterized lipoprotein YehR (DUF1307 family)